MRTASNKPWPWRTFLAILASASLVAVGWVSFRDMRALASADQWEKHTYQVLLELEEVMSALKDAETGQRGYLLTDKEEYLEPYKEAIREIGEHQDKLMQLTADNPSQQRRLAEIAVLTRMRLQILKQTIDLRRTQGFDAAVRVVLIGQSKAVMDSIRERVAAAQAEEQRLLGERTREKLSRVDQTVWALSLSGICGGGLLLSILFLLQREIAERKRYARELHRHQMNLEDLVQARTAALHQSEARLEGIVDSAMDAIISVDAGQRIVLFNAAAEKMFLCPSEDAFGASIERFIPERFRGAHAGHITRFGQTGATSRAMGHLGAVYGIRADGQEFPIEASISQIEVDGEKLYTVILRDISARVASEEEIRRMNAELEARVAARTTELQAANQELETFAYAVSHDLRGPLRAINGFTRILAAEYGGRLDENGRKYLENIATGAQRMGDLIEGLLELSRSTSGDFLRKRIDLSGMAYRILEEHAALEPARQVRCEIQEGLEAHGDPRMVEALLRNLLNNAWKYTARKDEALIRFYLEDGCDPPRYCISDNGAGFDMAHAAQLFQPFRRLHRQGDFPGIGIGLATVRRIVQRHGGEIKAHARPGEGARFCFTLPGRMDLPGP